MVHSITFVKGEVIPRYDETDGRVHFTDKVNGEYPNERRTDVDWGLVPSNASFVQAPEPKEYILEVDGIDNDGIDYSDAVTGRTLYKSRQGEWKFYRQALRNWSVGLPEIVNWLQGKKVSVITDDDPSYYYVGRITVSLESNEYWATVTMKYKLEAYKKYVYPSYQLDITGQDPVTLTPFDKKIYPVVWDLIDFEDAHSETNVITDIDYVVSPNPSFSYTSYTGIRRVLWPNGINNYVCCGDVLVNGVRDCDPNKFAVGDGIVTYDGDPVGYVESDSGEIYHRGGGVRSFVWDVTNPSQHNPDIFEKWYIVYCITERTAVSQENKKYLYYAISGAADRFVKNSQGVTCFSYGGVQYPITSIREVSVFNASVKEGDDYYVPEGSSVGYYVAGGINYKIAESMLKMGIAFGSNQLAGFGTTDTYDVSNSSNYDTSNVYGRVNISGTWYNVYTVSSKSTVIPETEKPIVPKVYVVSAGKEEDPDLTEIPYMIMVNSETSDVFQSQNLNGYEAYQLTPGRYMLQKLTPNSQNKKGVLLEWRKEKL